MKARISPSKPVQKNMQTLAVIAKKSQKLASQNGSPTTIPKLESRQIGISANDKTLTFSAASGKDFALEIDTPSEIAEHGEWAIKASDFSDMLKPTRLGSDCIEINAVDGHFWTKASGDRMEFCKASSLKLPPPIKVRSAGIRIDCDELRKLLSRVMPAAALEQSRYSLDGIVLDFEQYQATATATNGHVLFRAAGKTQTKARTACRIFVPRQAAQALERLLKQTDSDIRILSRNEGIAIFPAAHLADSQDHRWRMLLTNKESRIPPFEDILQSVKKNEYSRTIQAEACELNRQSQHVRRFIGQRKLGGKPSLATVGASHFTVERRDNHRRCIVNIPISTMDGNEIKSFGINEEFLAQATANLGETITIEVPAKSMLPVCISGEGFLAIIMPAGIPDHGGE